MPRTAPREKGSETPPGVLHSWGLSRAWPPFCPCWRENYSSASSTKPFSVKCVSPREDLRELLTVSCSGAMCPGASGAPAPAAGSPSQGTGPSPAAGAGSKHCPLAPGRLPPSPAGSVPGGKWSSGPACPRATRTAPRPHFIPQIPKRSPSSCSNPPFRGLAPQLAPSAHSPAQWTPPPPRAHLHQICHSLLRVSKERAAPPPPPPGLLAS